MSDEKNMQWHPAFTGAIHMEFLENKVDLEFQPEVILNTMPLRLDMILIKKKPEGILKNEIERTFKRYNFMEYKSSKDSLDYNTFLKGITYAYLYKSYVSHADEILLSEVTLTFIRERPPRKLFEKLKELNLEVEEATKEIYYISRFDDRNYASSVWEAVTLENKELIKRLRGNDEMFVVLAEIRKPEINEALLKPLFNLLKKKLLR